MNEIKSTNGSVILFNRIPRIECEDITIKVGDKLELFDYLEVYDEDNYPVGKDNIIIYNTNLDTSKAGNYEIVVEVNDKTNTYRVQRKIEVLVRTNDKPIIIGANDIEIYINELFDPMYGVIATDTEDGVITNKIIVNGFLNPCKLGEYILTYSVTDSDNNTTIVERKINVIEKEVEEENIKLEEYLDSKLKEEVEENVNTIDIINPVQTNNLEIENTKEKSISSNEDIEIQEEKKKPKNKKKRKKLKRRKKEKPQKLSRKEKKLLKKQEKQQKEEEKLKAREDKKALKEEYKKVDKNITDILPFLEISDDDSFKTRNGYIDIFQIETKDLNALNYDEVNRHIFDFSNFLRNYIDDMKIISMTFPVSTQVQQQHILNKIESTYNTIYKEFLYKRLDQLVTIEEKRKNREFYLMLFFDDETTKRERITQLKRLSNSSIKLKSLDLDKKIKIIFKLNNQNSKI